MAIAWPFTVQLAPEHVEDWLPVVVHVTVKLEFGGVNAKYADQVPAGGLPTSPDVHIPF